MGCHLGGEARAGRRTDGVGKDPVRFPVGDRPRVPRADGGCRAAGQGRAADPHPLHLPAEGARRRRRAQPPIAARRHRAVRTSARGRLTRRHRRRPLRRHDLQRPAQARLRPSRHSHHDPRVALPDAHEPRRRDAARRAHRDHRRSARGRRHEARSAPRREPGAPGRSSALLRSRFRARATHRPVGDRPADRRSRAVPRRIGSGRYRRAPGIQDLRDRRRRPDGRHDQSPSAARRSRRFGGCRIHRGHRVGMAARRGGDRRPHPAEQLHDRVLQLPAAGRAPHRPSQRDLLRADRASPFPKPPCLPR